MKAQARLQAAYARRREAEFNRIERTSAINKYFENWSKVTPRFEAWTDPEYYQQAEDSLRKEKEKKIKNEKLQERRNKLRQLLDAENIKYQEELKEFNKPKPRKLPNDLLEKLSRDQKYAQEEKRRLELESKLYGKWRYGINDENILFESRSDNQTLAKLNWLDKQIENRMIREQEEKQAEERHLKLLEETRKREENRKEQQKIREAEIKELRAMQESHMAEMKSRELQSSRLRGKELDLRQSLEKVENEMSELASRKAKKFNADIPHNIKRIKMFIRQRSEQIREDLQKDIQILNRILEYYDSDDVKRLRATYGRFYESEVQKQSTIEAMYESEAKENLLKWETEWARLSEDREAQISWVLQKMKKTFEAELSENLDEQRRVVEIRETLLVSIENSNEKLKAIVKEQESCGLVDDLADACSRQLSAGSGNDNGVLTPANRDDSDETPRRPQFGKKKIAWT